MRSFFVVIFILVVIPNFVWSQENYQSRLLPPFRINKSQEQILREAEVGRKHFETILETQAPVRKDLLPIITPVKDQGYRGTCVAFAITALMESQIKKFTGRTVNLSEQYLYWESKFIEAILPSSDGSLTLPMLKTIDWDLAHDDEKGHRGVPLAEVWPYEEYGWYANRKEHPECFRAAKVNDDKVPKPCLTNGWPSKTALEAPKFGVTQAQNIPSSSEAITGYLRLGIPVIASLDFYTRAWGFNNKRGSRYKTGVVLTPEPGDTDEGGHAVLLIGYDLESQIYLFKNSWGTTDWAKDNRLPGFGTIPFDYIRKYAIATMAKVRLP